MRVKAINLPAAGPAWTSISHPGPAMNDAPDTLGTPRRATEMSRSPWLMSHLPVVAIMGCILAILMIVPAGFFLDREYGFFTRDPTQIGKIPRYAGYLSGLGVMSWTAGAAISLFTAAVIPSIYKAPGRAGFFLYFGCFTALLACDDLFLIHENFVLGEKAVFLAYGIAALAGIARFRGAFRGRSAGFAKAAAAAFLVSLAIDRTQYLVEARIGDFRILVEDGAKFLGSVCWTIFLCRTGLDAISEGADARSPR